MNLKKIKKTHVKLPEIVQYERVVTKLFTENQTSKIVNRLCYFFL